MAARPALLLLPGPPGRRVELPTQWASVLAGQAAPTVSQCLQRRSALLQLCKQLLRRLSRLQGPVFRGMRVDGWVAAGYSLIYAQRISS